MNIGKSGQTVILAVLSVTAQAHYTCPDDEAASLGGPITLSRPEDLNTGLPTLFETQILNSATGVPESQFGMELSLDEHSLAIGRRDELNLYRGAVEVHSLSDGFWHHDVTVTSPTSQAYENFQAPAIDGNTLLVGAWGYCSSQPSPECQEGAAYLYERSDNASSDWEFVKQLDGGFKVEARFGLYVDLYHDTAIVPAPHETIGAAGRAGAVYVFERNHGGMGEWGLVKRLESDESQKTEGDGFGGQISIHGESLLVLGSDGSIVYEFGRHAGGIENWGLLQTLHVPNGQASFAFDGETLVLNVIDPCVPTEQRVSKLHFYSKNASGTWVEDLKIEHDFRVTRLAVDGSTLVAGAYDRDRVAYVYKRKTNPDGWELTTVLLSSTEPEFINRAVALDSGRALVSSPYADVAGRTDEGMVLHFEVNDPINTGHAGAWANLATLGQGQLIDVDAENQFIFLSWFTYTDANSANPNEQRWLTAQGHYSGSEAILPLYETLGGAFDDAQAVSTEQIGEVTLSFSDCSLGHVSYQIDGEGLSGEFPIERVIPGSGSVCEAESGSSLQAVDINAGMDGAWYDENTPGQGFLFDVHPDPEGGNFIFVAWFTYGEDTASGQRWLTAQGSFEGSTAEIDVYETLGGAFDDPQPTETTPVGTMTIDFSDCTHAQLGYALTDGSGAGQIDLARLLPDASGLCGTLSGTD